MTSKLSLYGNKNIISKKEYDYINNRNHTRVRLTIIIIESV